MREARVPADALFCWSGGKDSAMAVHALRAAGDCRIPALLAPITEEDDPISMDGVRRGGVAASHTGRVALGMSKVLCARLRLVRYVEKGDQKVAEQIIGVLYLDSRERGALRSASAQAALETLSAEAALAIENARLYREALDNAKFEQELRVAAAIQQSLLPVANRDGAFFSTAAASIACRAVGGDFFDYVDLPSGQFGFILGDVAGKGSPAALLAAAVLGVFRAEATDQA